MWVDVCLQICHLLGNSENACFSEYITIINELCIVLVSRPKCKVWTDTAWCVAVNVYFIFWMQTQVLLCCIKTTCVGNVLLLFLRRTRWIRLGYWPFKWACPLVFTLLEFLNPETQLRKTSWNGWETDQTDQSGVCGLRSQWYKLNIIP